MTNSELDRLATESRLPAAAGLDLRSTREQVELMAEQDRVAVDAVAATRDRLVEAIDATVARLRRGGRLVEVGAGTPGRLAVLDAAECGPTFGVDERQVVAVMAGGFDAVRSAAEHDEDDHDGGRSDLERLALGADDVVVAVSASGRTPYVLGALAAARTAGAYTVAVVNNAGSPIAAASDVAVEALTGPEVVAGSTRLKAGTAAKLVLNTISTLVMVQLGHTHGDLMIDVRATNDKLRRRAQRIVQEATGESAEAAEAALRAAGDETKTATVMLLAAVDAGEARRRLRAAGGRVRAAIAPQPSP